MFFFTVSICSAYWMIWALVILANIGFALRTMSGCSFIIFACCLSCCGVGICCPAALLVLLLLLLDFLFELDEESEALLLLLVVVLVDADNNPSTSWVSTCSCTSFTRAGFSTMFSSLVKTMDFFFPSKVAAFAFMIFFNCFMDNSSKDFKKMAASGLTAEWQEDLWAAQCAFWHSFEQ